MRQPETLNKIESLLIPGQVYRRSDFQHLSSNVDRHLVSLVTKGSLKKIAQGLYSAPKNTVFGEVPPDSNILVKSFLKDDHFVIYSPNQFNSLGVGTTQLYNKLVVFNRKRVGEFNLGGQVYHFYRWREAPKSLSTEFLMVELLNRINELSENKENVIKRALKKINELDKRKFNFCLTHYGTISAKNLVKNQIKEKRTGLLNE